MDKSPEQASHEAIEQTKKAQEAIENARIIQSEANDLKVKQLFTEAIKDAFGEKENSGRFIDTSRIPLICQDLAGIHTNMEKINDNIKWVVRLIIGSLVTGIIGLGFFTLQYIIQSVHLTFK